MSNKWFYIHALNLILIYIVGVCGILFTCDLQHSIFLKLSSLSLIITTVVVLLFHTSWNRNFILSAAIIFLFGFFIEVIGVKTGILFGNYWYGKTLGYKLMEVPVMIGVNWFLLIYIIAASFSAIKETLLFALICASTMTFLDVFIEPVAIKLDFWQWQNNAIPLQNYAAWFCISFMLFLFFRKANGIIKNRLSLVTLATQFLFFAILNLALK